MDETAQREQKQLIAAHVSTAATDNIMRWLTEPLYAEYTSELQSMIEAGQWQQLEDAFFTVIEFGTGGRRGTTGVGSNRINKVTIGESAQALCAYAQAADNSAAAKGVVIACDTRLSSPELSRYTAQVCAANGFKTYIFDSFRSTPELSFAVRELGCAVGIVISASHNPPADNGFKAYWSDGAQLVAPHDSGVLELAEAISTIKAVDFDEALQAGSIIIISADVDDAYVSAAMAEGMGGERDIKIAYSPLHGAGRTNVLPVLAAAGFDSIVTVEQQMIPDGNFPTVANFKPNPEEKAANDLVVQLMLDSQADIAITNDPDADRIGVMVRQADAAVYLNGNQLAALATDYVLGKMQAAGSLTPQHFVAKTIVTTDLLNALASHYGVQIYDNMLIGFKYIGALIRNKEATAERFVIGGEESYGLLKGTYARDKDGASGALLMAEYAAELKLSGRTLYDRLLELYQLHGVFVERLDTVYCLGADGFAQMQAMMTKLRTETPTTIGDHAVTAVCDYSSLERRDIVTGQTTTIDCVKGNVMVLECGDKRRRITVRPSGTEPKIKFYMQWFDETDESAEQQYQQLDQHLQGLSKELESWLLAV